METEMNVEYMSPSPTPTMSDAEADMASFSFVNHSALCFEAVKTTSSGIWVGDIPFAFSFPTLLIQIIVIFTMTRLAQNVFKPLGLPHVVSHVIAGMVLGPSFLGRSETVASLFPPRSWVVLDVISYLSYTIMIFMISVKTDLRIMRTYGGKAFFIGWTSFFSPLILVATFSCAIDSVLPYGLNCIQNLPSLIRWVVTSNAVLASLLCEQNLLTSKIGRLAMSASLVIDFQQMIIMSLTSASTVGFTSSVILKALGAYGAFVGMILLVARPTVLWMVRKTPRGRTMGEGYIVVILLIVLFCAFFGMVIGQSVANGAFLLGLVLPGGPPLGRTLVERVERILLGLLMPIFTAAAGMRINLFELTDASVCGYTMLLMTVCAVTKLVSVVLAGLCSRLCFKDALALGLMLNCRGIVELYTYTVWIGAESIDDQEYSLYTLAMMTIGGITASLLKLVYSPSSHYRSNRRLSIRQSSRREEVRILACTHDEHNTTPMITILETSLPNPTCIYLLHLIPLVGETTTTLELYKNIRKGSHSSVTDHIVRAFRNFEDNYPGSLSVIPYVGISPYISMHDDICQLAVDKMIALVVLPFHKRNTGVVGAIESASSSIRAMNLNVLQYCPCSVAIYIDNGLSNGECLYRNVAMYFLGGADDREALAYAACMADNNAISLTLIRLALPKDFRDMHMEDRLDDSAVNEFRMTNARNKRVDYREEVVRDGAETVAAIRDTSDLYGLLIVGRREGERSALTAGLEVWNDYPELGLIGDLLASTDLGSNVSTLVVQLKPTVGEDGKSMFSRYESLMKR